MDNILELKYNMLVSALFSGSELDYSKRALEFNSYNEATTLLKYIEPEKYHEILGRLQSESNKIAINAPSDGEAVLCF